MAFVVGTVVNFIFETLLAYEWLDPTLPVDFICLPIEPVDLMCLFFGITSTDLFLWNIFEILDWIRDL